MEKQGGFLFVNSRVFSIFVPLLALGVSVAAFYFGYVDRSQARLVPQNQVADEQLQADIERTYERAQDAIQSAELVLSFLEGASVLAGIILVGAGVLGISSIQDLRQDTEHIKQEVLNRLETAERELLSRAEQLAALEAELENTIQESQKRFSEQITQAAKDAQNAFEALSHHVMAQRLARERNIDAAIRACRDAHTLDPDNVPNNYLLGTLLLRKEELDEAIRFLKLAFDTAREDQEHTSPPAQAALGFAIRKKGDALSEPMERNRLYNQAESYLLDAVRAEPHLLNDNNESYYGILGSLYRRQGRTADAITAYQHAARITPRRSYPEINLAMLCLQTQEFDESARHCQRAEEKARRRLEDTPDDYWASHDVALALLLRGKVDEALSTFHEALELTPDIMALESVMSRLQYLNDLPIEIQGLEKAIAIFTEARMRFVAKSKNML